MFSNPKAYALHDEARGLRAKADTENSGVKKGTTGST